MLPVEEILAELSQQLLLGDSIVVAPPGAGKSTRLPLYLLEQKLFAASKIVMLQPRRVAARSIALYLAEQLGEAVGQTIGYRVKGDTKVSANTRLEIVTEGVLTRMLQSDPELSDVGLVVFDEFHERSIHADFSLALCLEVQQALREDLRLLVMSATLDVQALQRLMPEAKLLQSEGRAYPVDVHYRPNNHRLPLHEKVTQLVLDVCFSHSGDGLVFLPGATDIKKTAEKLHARLGDQLAIHLLYSDVSMDKQDIALQPDAQGKQKIILATNIAETSLTIEGISWVVDSGIEKQGVFDLNRGITHLRSQKISQASATQRAGRAGRLGPGTCYRMWSREQQDRLNPQAMPDILLTDMSSFILESTIWGTQVKELSLIDYPSDAQLAQGVSYLQSLELVGEQGKLSDLGRQVHNIAAHPSIGVMLLKSQGLSTEHLSLACALAALLESKDPLGLGAGAEVSARLHYLLSNKGHPIWRAIKQWHNKLGCSVSEWPFEDVAVLIAFAFPQWIAKRRGGLSYQLVNGAGAVLNQADPLIDEKWLAVANMQTTDAQQDNAMIRFAEPISMAQIQQYFSHLMCEQQQVQWQPEQQKIVAVNFTAFGKIKLNQQAAGKPSAKNIRDIWRQVIAQKGIEALPFSEHDWQLIYRTRLAKQYDLNNNAQHNWPDASGKG